MNKLQIDIIRKRLVQIISSALIVFATALIVSALLAQPSPEPKGQWPKPGEKHKAAIEAFTKTLTRAGHDKSFRERLIKPDSAKLAVAEEGNIDIPDTEVIVFYENEAQSSGERAPSQTHHLTKGTDLWTKSFDGMRNEHYHFFCLPPYKEGSAEKYIYQDWQTGAYPVWWE